MQLPQYIGRTQKRLVRKRETEKSKRKGMKRSTDMTTGSPAPLILRLAIPLILTNLGQQLYQVADAAIVGRSVGVSAFASLGACDWLYWLVLWGVTALTQGFSSVVAQKFGSGDRTSFRKAICMCVLVCAAAGCILTGICTCAAGPLLQLLRTEEAIFAGAKTYLTIMYGGTLIVLAYNMAGAILRAVGDGRTPLYAMCVAGSANIALDLLFVTGLGWGIPGAAAATLLAQLLSFVYCLAVICRNPLFRMERGDFRPDSRTIAELCRMGIPQALSQCVTASGGIYAQSVINTFGYVVVAGCTAANKLHTFMDCSAVALGFAVSTFVAQNYGAKQMDRVRSGMRRGVVLALALAVLIMTAVLCFGRQLVGLFLASDMENAAAALDVAHRYVRVLALCLPAAYLMNLYRYCLQGIGNTVAPMLSGACEMGARVCAAAFLPPLFEQTGLFLMDGSAWAAAGIFQGIAFYVSLRRRQSRVPAGNIS